MVYIPQYTIEAHDIAMDSFRAAWKQVHTAVKVSDDGMRMYIKIHGNDRQAAAMLLAAQHVISANRLPLEADVLESKITGLTYDRTLLIKFDKSLTELPCY